MTYSLNLEILIIRDITKDQQAKTHYREEARLNEMLTRVTGSTAPEVVVTAHITDIFYMVFPSFESSITVHYVVKNLAG